jgi:glucan phosphoethanolaminetransferase (alkaline phosphatase superfamily)
MDRYSKGFSVLHNYWCNLLHQKAINGEDNKARPVALAAMGILGVTISLFFFIFPLHTTANRTLKIMIPVCGTLSMATLLLMEQYHDAAINVSAFIGMIAVAGTFRILYQLKWMMFFGMGIFNVLLVILNNILYYGEGLLYYLPIVQKITFVSFLLWIFLMNGQLLRTGRMGAPSLP